MMTKHWCKSCFKAVVDDTAADIYLLMSGDSKKCDCCGKIAPLVGTYFKYGEKRVTEDGLRMVSAARHLGLNPNYSFWGSEDAYGNGDKPVDIS